MPNMSTIPLTLGVEEEYQIIHPETRKLHSYVQEFLEAGKMILPEGQLKPEFMQSQIEVGSNVCRNIKEVRLELQRLRRSVNTIAEENNLHIAAASTHPFSTWNEQNINAGIRYKQLLDQMKDVASQLLIFGFHIHVGMGENKDLQIEIMNQLRYFLPHILALSTSSPFWQGRKTGLMSYRSVVFEMLPRTGIPHSFNSYAEFERFVDLLGRVGTIDQKVDGKADGTKIWWDVRPHPKFGTLEVRIADICTNLEDAVTIAALIQALIHRLIQLRRNNQSWRRYRQFHINENKWRAMRYGLDGNLIDFGREEEIPMRFLAMELLDFVEESAKELGSWEEIKRIENILADGTSAHKQIRRYEKAIANGKTEEEALLDVVDFLVEETMAGVL